MRVCTGSARKHPFVDDDDRFNAGVHGQDLPRPKRPT
jgi:hypothetical protein